MQGNIFDILRHFSVQRYISIKDIPRIFSRNQAMNPMYIDEKIQYHKNETLGVFYRRDPSRMTNQI